MSAQPTMDTLSAGPHAVDELYVCKLDAATELKAIKELNEDPKDRLNAVRALRTWLLQQPHITFPTGFFGSFVQLSLGVALYIVFSCSTTEANRPYTASS